MIELLVVISVIALLMAILMPCLHRVRKQARGVACQSNLRQSGVYFAAYEAENEGKFALVGNKLQAASVLLRFIPAVAGPSWNRDLLLCPAATQSPKKSPFPVVTGTFGDTFSAWQCILTGAEGVIPDSFLGSYGFNLCACNPYDAGTYRGNVKTDDVKMRLQIPFCLDCVGPSLGPGYSKTPPPPYEGFMGTDGYSSLIFSVINRHDGGINCLFMDWSVRKVGLKELWTLKWSRDWNTRDCWTRAGGVKPEDWPRWIRRFKDY